MNYKTAMIYLKVCGHDVTKFKRDGQCYYISEECFCVSEVLGIVYWRLGQNDRSADRVIEERMRCISR